MEYVISLEECLEEPGETEVRIPDYVTKILDRAIPDSVISVVIPKSVTEIEPDAFNLCKDLLSITVDPDNLDYCDIDGVLYSKDKTELVRYPRGRQDTEYVIPDHVTEIGDFAFAKCNELRSITLPDSVTTIGKSAFLFSGLTSIHLPDSIKTIVNNAFCFCSELTSIQLSEGLTEIQFCTFVGCKKLETVCIPKSVTTISSRAFWCCDSLTSVLVPDSVTKIEDYSFIHCDRLTILTIPGSYADKYAKKNEIPVEYITCD